MRPSLPALAFLALMAATVPAAPAIGAESAAPESTTVILLGTGMPAPNAHAQGPATLVKVGRRMFLFDAGPGVMRQIDAAGLPYRGGTITAAFLTHLHSDHTLGLPDLILTSWVMGRRAPLRLIGPKGTQRMVDHIVDAWSEDISVRTEGLEHASRDGWRCDVREVEGGVVYDSAGVTVRAIPVAHGSWHSAFGYRIDTPTRSIVISGDTAPCPALLEAARGVDVLIHEVYPASRLAPEARPGGEDWVKYMHAFHTSDRELGALARDAQPRLLVLHHIVRMGGRDEELLAGVRAGGFEGRVVVGHDLDRW